MARPTNWTGLVSARNFVTSSARSTTRAPDEYADSVTDLTLPRGSLGSGGARLGDVNTAGDHDIFTINMVSGYQYTILLRGAGSAGGTLPDPLIYGLYTSSGSYIPNTTNDDILDGVNLDSRLLYTASTTGVHLLEVGGYLSNIGTYHVSVLLADDGADSLADVKSPKISLAINSARNGTIEVGGDVDLYKLALVAGTTYTINLSGLTLTDPKINGIIGPNGVVIVNTSNDDSGGTLNSQVVFKATTTGFHYVQASAYGTTTGTYKIEVVQGNLALEIPANTATTAVLGVNDKQYSRIHSGGDVDWFKVTLAANQTYIFEQTKNNNSATPLADAKILGIYTSAGALIANTTNDDFAGTTNAHVSFRPTTAGTYYVAAGAYSTYTGDYAISLTSTTTNDTISATTATTGLVSVGGAVNGIVNSARDVDWYRVALVAGQQYVVDLKGEATNNGTLSDPEIFGVYNAAGVVLPGTGNDDIVSGNLNSRAIFIAPTTGNYFLAAGGHYEAIGTYRLSIATQGTPELPNNATTNGVVAVNGSLQNSINTAGDVDWIKVSLVAGQNYRINLDGFGTTGALADPIINGIYSSNGQLLSNSTDDDSGAGLNSLLNFRATASGVHFISVGGYEDLTGNYRIAVTPIANTDLAAPTLLAKSPADGTTGVAVGANLSLSFNEAVKAGAGNIVITGSNGTTRNIAVTDASQVSFSGEVMNINPSTDLAAGVSYTVRLGAGVVKDLAGNNFAGITTTTAFNFNTAAAPPAGDAWTIMVYIAGDNNLEGFGISDLNEMEIPALPANVNVVFLYDRAPGYDTSNGNWTDTRVGAITRDTNTGVVTSTMTSLGEQNTGNGTVLTTFIDWAAVNYQAQNYGLVLWDHGGGLSGVCWDDTSNDNLSLKELKQAVDNSIVNKFGFVGFDACLMAMAEQVFDFQILADVVVASQELEPGDGWAYDRFLPSLVTNPNMTATQLASSIVSTYGTEYAGQTDITLSAMRTTTLNGLDLALDTFIVQALAASAADLTKLRTAAAAATLLDASDANRRDLGDFMDEIAATVTTTGLRNAAINVATAVDNVVFARSGTVSEVNGISIYLPYGTIAVDAGYTATNYDFLNKVAWDDFLAIL